VEANNRVNRVVEIITAVGGIGVIVLSAIYVIVGLILRRSLIYITYFLGDLISRTTMRIGSGFGYRLYSKLMLISSDLDNEDILWKTPNKEYPDIEQAHKHQRRK
jgi:hypothetical protein